MNGTDLTFHPEAAEEPEVSTAWYVRRSVPAAVQFVAQVEYALEQLAFGLGMGRRGDMSCAVTRIPSFITKPKVASKSLPWRTLSGGLDTARVDSEFRGGRRFSGLAAAHR